MTSPRAPRKMLALKPATHAKLVKLAKRNRRTLDAQIELLIDAQMLY